MTGATLAFLMALLWMGVSWRALHRAPWAALAAAWLAVIFTVIGALAAGGAQTLHP